MLKASRVLLLLNVIGAVAYVVAASWGGWAIPEERAAGIHSITGEPFIWALSVLPIVAVFLVLNLTWGIMIVARRRWQLGRLWLLTVPVWFVAIVIDFAHH